MNGSTREIVDARLDVVMAAQAWYDWSRQYRPMMTLLTPHERILFQAVSRLRQIDDRDQSGLPEGTPK